MPATTFKPDTLQRLAEAGLDPARLPEHIAVIMDGNGRWAQQRGLPRVEGHARGAVSVRTVVEECCRLGVGQLTLYCLSSENWKRPKTELDFLMALLETVPRRGTRARSWTRTFASASSDAATTCRSRCCGEIDESIRLSQDNTGMGLCLAINYGGRTELIDAVRSLARQVRDGRLDPDAIDEAAISGALYTAGTPDPDLLIRTAGEMRISNFLLWQISYAELWVTSRCWPDFDRATLHQALRDYAARERRFGGLT